MSQIKAPCCEGAAYTEHAAGHPGTMQTSLGRRGCGWTSMLAAGSEAHLPKVWMNLRFVRCPAGES